MKKSTVQAIALVAASVCVTLLGLELSLRVYNGKLFNFESLLDDSASRAKRISRVARVQYDQTLGWTPTIGRSVSHWTANVDSSGLRSNGRSISAPGRPILAIGDSFTFGDEVADEETWVAALERRLNKRVLNAGVSAYGVDQAVLRAERLLDEYQPDIVILSFVSDDINRTEFDYFPYGRGWKPYFELVNGSLSLRNVPVPQTPRPVPFAVLRDAFGHSYFARFVLSRAAPRWWRNIPSVNGVHADGENVTIALVTRLDSIARSRGAHFVAVAFASNALAKGNEQENARLPGVTRRARASVRHVLDLSTETLQLHPDSLERRFLPGGHHTAPMNAWVAERISAFLQENDIIPSTGSRSLIPRPVNAGEAR